MTFYFSGNVVDQNQIPVVGAEVYVFADGVLARLVDADGNETPNPTLSIVDGFYEARTNDVGEIKAAFNWAGRERYVREVSRSAEVVAAAATALAASGPNYASTAAGIAATTVGDTFAVDEGDTIAVYRHDAGPIATFLRRFIQAPELASGASLVGFQQSGTGAVTRTVSAKLRETVSVKDFGAVGDGVANDTAAFTSALAYITSTGHPVFVPPGTYLTDPFQIAPQTYALQGFFYGEEAENTIIRRRTTGAGAFVTIGSASGTIFQASLDVKGLTIDGGATTNGPACVMYDVVRSLFDGVKFKGGSRALHMLGGISVTFDHCWFQDSVQGLRVEKFTSLAGGGWPNIIRLTDCHWNENTEWGVWFDNGRMIIIDGGQVEGNGTTLAAAQGGVYVGANIGEEVAANDPESIGLICNSTWFEANRGVADVHLLSGINTINDSNFFSTSAQVSNDIKIDGGRYRLRNLNMSFSKTANVLEGASVTLGNTIDFVQAGNLSFNSGKTALNNGSFSQIGNGAVPGCNAMTAPLIQRGTESASVNPTITFNQAFKAGTTPRVICQVINNSTGTIDAPEIYSVTNTEFIVRKKSFNGTTITTSNYGIHWIALGENP